MILLRAGSRGRDRARSSALAAWTSAEIATGPPARGGRASCTRRRDARRFALEAN
jgi:hypothetical protein